LLSFLAECQTRGCLPHAVLLDAFSRDAYGGTGQTIDWEQVHALQSHWPQLPIILAGGLHAANVAEAIQAAQPAAVDTASGVESSPGVKDHAKIAAFVTAAKYSWALSSGDPPEN
jgi:phosphoribosylanthranilate isomerase